MAIKLVRFVVRRTLKRKPNAITRSVPFIIELSKGINFEHIQSMCTTMMEIETATLAVQMVAVLIRMSKIKPK